MWKEWIGLRTTASAYMGRDRRDKRATTGPEARSCPDVLVPSDAYHPSVPTQAPDLEASKDLLDLANTITRTDKESFIGAFNDWYEKYQDILNERQVYQEEDTSIYAPEAAQCVPERKA